jgi:hypothetical protein
MRNAELLPPVVDEHRDHHRAAAPAVSEPSVGPADGTVQAPMPNIRR